MKNKNVVSIAGISLEVGVIDHQSLNLTTLGNDYSFTKFRVNPSKYFSREENKGHRERQEHQ